MCDKYMQLSVETVYMNRLPAKSLGWKPNHVDSLNRKPIFVDSSLRRKQEIPEVSAEAKYDRQSQIEAKIGTVVYTLFIFKLKMSSMKEHCDQGLHYLPFLLRLL